MRAELFQQNFRTSTPTSSLKCVDIESGSCADGERVAVVNTNSTSSTFKKDVFTVMN